MGETIRQIVELKKMKQDPDTRYQITLLENRLRYLKSQEIEYLSERLEEIRTEIVRCEPGQWAEWEGLRGECEASLNRLRKEVADAV